MNFWTFADRNGFLLLCVLGLLAPTVIEAIDKNRHGSGCNIQIGGTVAVAADGGAP